MNKVLVTALAFLMTSCGIGKQGDKTDRNPDPTPAFRNFYLSKFQPSQGRDGHIPVIRGIKLNREDFISTALLFNNGVDMTDAGSFMTTYLGPGELLPGSYYQRHPISDVNVYFKLVDGLTIREYQLVLYYTTQDTLVGQEYIRTINSKTFSKYTTSLQVTFDIQ